MGWKEALFFWTILALGMGGCAAPAVRKPDPRPATAYGELLDRGRELMGDRRYSAALEALAAAEGVDPAGSEARALRAAAWFRLDRFEEVAAACAGGLAQDPGLTWLLPTCWGAELETAGFDAEAEARVRGEIEARLTAGEPSLDLLFAAHRGYQYLQDRGRLRALALEIADAARIYLRERAAAGDTDGDDFGPGKVHGHRRLCAGLAAWLMGRGEEPLRAAGLLEESLALLEAEGLSDLLLDGKRLFRNRGDGTFADRTWISGTRVENGWGAAFADYDRDGDPDLAVGTRNGVRLFRNDTPGADWLAVRIEDPRCNRFGVGARVTVTCGGRVQVREVTAGRGTGSQDSLALPFGLGGCAGPVEVTARTLCGDTLTGRAEEPGGTLILGGDLGTIGRWQNLKTEEQERPWKP